MPDLTVSANVDSLMSAANYAAVRALLDLEAGTDFYSVAAADAAFATAAQGATADAALPKDGGQISGNITCVGAQTFDGRDVSADGAILDSLNSVVDQDVTDGSAPLFVGTNFSGIPNGALTTNPLARANHTGTQAASTVSDFSAAADARIAAAVLDDLADVTETTITTGDLLRWNGSAWVNYADTNFATGSEGDLASTAVQPSTAPTLTGTNITGTAAGLTAGTCTTIPALTGDVTSSGNATTIAAGAVDLAMLSATGTPSGSNFLRGDNTWAAASGGIAWSGVPASSAATGTAGDIAYDDSYIYICTATNTWTRAALSTW